MFWVMVEREAESATRLRHLIPEQRARSEPTREKCGGDSHFGLGGRPLVRTITWDCRSTNELARLSLTPPLAPACGDF